MLNTNDDNFDDIDLDELFNDFYENPQQLLTKYNSKPKTSQDELTEFNENDCTAPRIIRKRVKNKKKANTKQMTMYDYASSISYKHKQFYSSLDNTTTTKTIIKGQKRPLKECQQQQSSSIAKNFKTNNYENLSPSPDFIDKLLKYLDERSRNIPEQESLKTNEIKKKKHKSSIL